MGLMADPATATSVAGRLPDPEHVFLCWLLARNPEEDLAVAAEREIRRLGRYKGSHPGPRRLAELFETLRGRSATAISNKHGLYTRSAREDDRNAPVEF